MFRIVVLLSVLSFAALSGEPAKVAKPALDPLPKAAEIAALESKDEARVLAAQVCATPELWSREDLEARRTVLLAISKRAGPGMALDVNKNSDVVVSWSSNKGTVSHLDLLWVSAAPNKEDLLVRYKALKLTLQVQQDHLRVLPRFIARNATDFADSADKIALYDWLDAQKSGMDTKGARARLKELK